MTQLDQNCRSDAADAADAAALRLNDTGQAWSFLALHNYVSFFQSSDVLIFQTVMPVHKIRCENIKTW